MLGISSEARFTENVRANFVVSWLRGFVASWLIPHVWRYFISFHCLKEVRSNLGTLIQNTIFFSICCCEHPSGKGSSKINKSKVAP